MLHILLHTPYCILPWSRVLKTRFQLQLWNGEIVFSKHDFTILTKKSFFSKINFSWWSSLCPVNTLCNYHPSSNNTMDTPNFTTCSVVEKKWYDKVSTTHLGSTNTDMDTNRYDSNFWKIITWNGQYDSSMTRLNTCKTR